MVIVEIVLRIRGPFNVMVATTSMMFCPIVSPSCQCVILVLRTDAFMGMVVPVRVSMVFMYSIFFNCCPQTFKIFNLVTTACLRFVPVILVVFGVICPLVQVVRGTIGCFNPIMAANCMINAYNILW